MINRLFARVSAAMGAPTFWAFIVGVLLGAFLLNLLSGNRFDPGMAYSNFLQNWLQLLALAVTSVAAVAMSTSVDRLHEKHDDLHRALSERDDGERAE